MAKRKVEAADDDEVDANPSEQENEVKPEKSVKKVLLISWFTQHVSNTNLKQPRSIKKPKVNSDGEDEAPQKLEKKVAKVLRVVLSRNVLIIL